MLVVPFTPGDQAAQASPLVHSLRRHERAASGPAVARWLLPVLLLMCACSGLELANAGYVAPLPPYRPKEAALVHSGLEFHLYFTRGDPDVPFDSTWRDLGHAVSPDIYTWVEVAPVMPARPDHWDNWQVWAPAIVETDSIYYMFYVGVSHRPPTILHHQRIGLATSHDLVNWTRLDAPVFSCSQVPWTYCDSTKDGAGDFRDPFVMPDPDSTGRWLMYYTTRHKDAPGQLMIGIAKSSGDFTAWRDAGPMWNTTKRYTGSDVTETPDLIHHGDLWYLLYTTWNTHPIWYQTAASPTADSTGWSPQQSLFDEVPYLESDPSFGPEHYSWHGHDYYYMPNSDLDVIQLLEYDWSPYPHFLLVDPTTTRVAPESPGGLLALRATGRAGAVRFTIDLPGALGASLWISDPAGRRVRRVLRETLPAGRSEREWNGRSETGDALPAGVYFAVLETTVGRRVARFVLLH